MMSAALSPIAGLSLVLSIIDSIRADFWIDAELYTPLLGKERAEYYKLMIFAFKVWLSFFRHTLLLQQYLWFIYFSSIGFPEFSRLISILQAFHFSSQKCCME